MSALYVSSNAAESWGRTRIAEVVCLAYVAATPAELTLAKGFIMSAAVVNHAAPLCEPS